MRFNLDSRLSKITFEIWGFFLNKSKYGYKETLVVAVNSFDNALQVISEYSSR